MTGFRTAELRTLLPEAPRRPLTTYASRFDRWNDLSSVRRRPRRELGRDTGAWFSPHLFPVMQHPEVTALPTEVRDDLLLLRLYEYLDFTTELENVAVIPVAGEIARGTSGLCLPDRMRADAYKIVTDEAWHAQFSFDFVLQLQHATGLRPPPTAGYAFSRRLTRIRAELPTDVLGCEQLVFAVVSETLISGILAEIPRDENIRRPVRDLVRDHEEDEGRHHVYFRGLLRHLWSAFTPAERRAVGPHVPAMIFAFLEPDYARAARHLARVGVAAPVTDQVVAESWPDDEVTSAVAEAARPTVRYFAEVGALDDPATHDAFEAAGLLPT